MENDSYDSGKLESLHERLELLLLKQEASLKEIYALKSELLKLKRGEQQQSAPFQHPAEPTIEKPEITGVTSDSKLQTQEANESEAKESRVFEEKLRGVVASTKQRSDWERFIGENLISKIGIVITVIGVGIGAKYAIDHQLISPLTRILLGYLVGLGLFAFSMRLKRGYENFSAVLLSGAMAILYFITYAAYSFYGLIPQPFTFFLMVMFTVFTVIASLKYNQQIIAQLGMVGAYTVPFLLSNDSGRIDILFSYIAIINAGLLFISFRKYWKALFYAAFILTWIIYAGWYWDQFVGGNDFWIALGFLCIYFTMFYFTFISYKLVKNIQFGLEDIVLLLANSFIFYGLGYTILEDHNIGRDFLGAFTLVNAFIHFVVARVLIVKKLADQNLVSFVTGLVLVYVTISIPVQLDGNWVTLVWVFQSALLFWIGRAKGATVYEILSYPLMMLAFGSLAHDWVTVSNQYHPSVPESRVNIFMNIQFFTSLLSIVAFGFINYVHRNKNSVSTLEKKNWYVVVLFGLPIIFLSSVFLTFRIEIMTYWDQLFIDSGVAANGEANNVGVQNFNLRRLQTVWLVNFSVFYFLILSYLNIKKFRSEVFGIIVLLLSALTIFSFLTQELLALSQLRDSYLNQSASPTFNGLANLWIRYVGIGLVAGLFWYMNQHIRQDFIRLNVKIPFVVFFYTSVLWILSSELINWMDIGGSNQSYKLGLSILWGIYAMVMVVIGIWKGRKFMRVAAIVLLAVTLLKLFFYDISDLDTISKTIVLVSLGILLLVISFLYNKYKQLIFIESDE